MFKKFTLTEDKTLSKTFSSAYRSNNNILDGKSRTHKVIVLSSYSISQIIFTACDCCRSKITILINLFLPTVPTFAVRKTDVSRHNGGTRGAPILPREVSLSDSNCWNGGHEWVNPHILFTACIRCC